MIMELTIRTCIGRVGADRKNVKVYNYQFPSEDRAFTSKLSLPMFVPEVW